MAVMAAREESKPLLTIHTDPVGPPDPSSSPKPKPVASELSHGEAAILFGVRIPPAVAGSAIACGMLQLVFFCAQNILQEAVTHTAADIGLSGIGLVLAVSETCTLKARTPCTRESHPVRI